MSEHRRAVGSGLWRGGLAALLMWLAPLPFAHGRARADDRPRAVARATVLERLLRELRALDAQRLPVHEVARFADLDRALALPLAAAERAGLAEADPPPT